MVKRTVCFQLVISVICYFFVTGQLYANIDSSIEYIIDNKNVSAENLVLWQRQLLTIVVTVKTDEEFSYFKKTDGSYKGFKVTSASHSNQLPGEDLFTKQLFIYVWPLLNGISHLNIKPAYLFLSGRSIKQINIPEIPLKIRPLPSYLPPDIPVGKINITTEYISTDLIPFVFITNQLSSALYRIESEGIAADFLPAYYKSLSADSLTALQPLKINTTESSDWKYSLTQEYETPFVTTVNGIVNINEIKISYFDPEHSKLISFKTGSASLLSLRPLIRNIFIVLFIVVSIWLINKCRLLLLFILHRRRLWQDIFSSNEVETLTSSLYKLYPLTPKSFKSLEYDKAVDLSCWAKAWQNKSLSNAISELNRLNYSSSDKYTLESTKKLIIKLLKRHEHFIFYLGVKNRVD